MTQSCIETMRSIVDGWKPYENGHYGEIISRVSKSLLGMSGAIEQGKMTRSGQISKNLDKIWRKMVTDMSLTKEQPNDPEYYEIEVGLFQLIRLQDSLEKEQSW